MLRIGVIFLYATIAMPCSARSKDIDDFDKLKPLDQLRALNRNVEKTTPLGNYSALVDGWEISFQSPADKKPTSAWLTPTTDTRSKRYAKAFKAYSTQTGQGEYSEGVFSFVRDYAVGFSLLNFGPRYSQLEIDCDVLVYLDKSDWSGMYRRNFMVPNDLLKEVGQSYRRDFMVRSYHDGNLYPAGAVVNEIVIDGRKWFHRWRLTEMTSYETYSTALAKDRILKITISYNLFIPEKYYHPDSPRPGWMQSAYESVNTIMSSIKLKPPPGYDEKADPYIVKPAKRQ